jgi:hypothetical protein
VIHVLDVLIAPPHGPGRNGAAVLVSDELARHGIQYSPQTVLGWRDEANQNDVMPMVQDIRKQLKNLRIEANPPSASPKDIVTQLIPAASDPTKRSASAGRADGGTALGHYWNSQTSILALRLHACKCEKSCLAGVLYRNHVHEPVGPKPAIPLSP